MKTMLCVNSDAGYVVFSDSPKYTLKYIDVGDGKKEWRQVGRAGVYDGVHIPERCLATNWHYLSPGEGPFEMK